MEKKLLNKNIIITGASNGIGREIAIAFANEGAHVFATYCNDLNAAQDLKKVIEEKDGKIAIFHCDLANFENHNKLLNKALTYFDHIDVLVNNAGVVTRTPFVEITPEQFEYIFTVNFKAPFFITQKVTKHMIENSIRGSIINISSLSAERAVSKVAHYQCAKAALTMLTKSAAYELSSHGIRVNTISPGLTTTKGNRDQWLGNTEIWQQRVKQIPIGRAATPNDYVGIATLFASDESSWITGANINVDGGQSTI